MTPDIVHILPPEPFGGAQILALELANWQRRAGLKVRFVFTAHSDEARQRAHDLGIPASSPSRGASRPARMLCTLLSLRTREAPLLHIHLPPPWLALVLHGVRHRAVVFHLHSAPPNVARPIDWISTRAVLRRSSRALAVSCWTAERWRSAFQTGMPECDVVFNAVAIPGGKLGSTEWEGRPDRPPTFGIATRLASDKGLDSFLAIAAEILQMAPEARFRVAGSGPYEGQLRRNIERLQLQSSLSLHGFVSDIAEFWRGIDVSLFTAPNEPFGLRLLEPILAGAIVVAFRTGAGSDEVIDRCRGIVSVPDGSVSGAAQLALALVGDRQRRRRMIADGRADIERWFSFDRMGREIGEAYERAIHSRPGRNIT